MRIVGGQMKDLFVIGLMLFFVCGCSSEYQEVHITIEDFRFTPTLLHVHPDQPMRLVVRNQGREIHRFHSRILSSADVTIKGEGKPLAIDTLQGIPIPQGKSLELILMLSSGIYEFQCPIRGHRGMKGMVVVERAGSKSPFWEK